MEQPTGNAATKSTRKSDEGPACLYPSKRCNNLRGVKRNGDLHNFCDFHRNKANFNQRRLEHKRKYEQVAAPKAASLTLEKLNGIPAPFPSRQQVDTAIETPYHELPSTLLEPDDIWILEELLMKSGNSSDENTGGEH